MPDKRDYGDGHIRWTGGSGRGGRFAPAGGKTTPAGSAQPRRVPAPTPRALKRASNDDLTDWAHRVSARPAGTPGVAEALTALDAELARREAAEVDLAEKSRRTDQLVAGGWSYLDAYAEAHGRDVRDLQREERMALVDAQRRPGERRAKTLQRMYDAHLAAEVLQAEDDTRGNLLSPAGVAEDRRRRRAGSKTGLDPASLWQGPADRARKYASDELKAWWSEHGGRMTAGLFYSHYTGDKAAAERARSAGQGKDYGV